VILTCRTETKVGYIDPIIL